MSRRRRRAAARALAGACCLALAACAGPDARGGAAPGEALIAYAPPAGGLRELPAAPAIRGRGGDAPPSDGELPPGGAVADRFTAEGQHATYRFRAGAGELSLFEVSCLGYARGWEATLGLRVLDGAGAVLLDRARPGGASFGAFVAFVAPADGAYRLELRALVESCRYAVVRHVGLAPNAAGTRVDLGAGDRLVGYLADGGDRARIALDLAAGERALVAVAPYRERVAKGESRRRGEALEGALDARAHDAVPHVDALVARLRSEEGPADQPPSDPLLQLERDGARAALVHLRPGEARTVALDVVALGPSEGGLFEVTVERDPPMHRLQGRVGDEQDDPVAGVGVYLLRAPSLTPLAELSTGADGRFTAELPAGTYTVLLHAGPGTPIERVEAQLDEARELNVIYE